MSVWAVLTASDHPRIRGEHRWSSRVRTILTGSSPHTRGALWAAGKYLSKPGIIPAYAGSTEMRASITRPPSDHPRIRGEHAGAGDGRVHDLGSSPHTRGAHAAEAG